MDYMEIEPENVVDKVFQCTELLLHILGYLEQDELYHAMQTCKEFHEATQIPTVWRKVTVTPYTAKALQLPHLSRIQHLTLKSFSDCHFNNIYINPHIRELSIQHCTASPALINALLQHLSQLESLSIDRLGSESESIIVTDMTPTTRPVYTIQNLPNLKRLSVNNTDVELNLPNNLIELVVENCGIVQYKKFLQSLEQCSQIKVLKLWCITPGFSFMQSLEDLLYWKNKLPSLQVLQTHLYDIRYRDTARLLEEWQSIREIGYFYDGLIVNELKKAFPHITFNTCSFPQAFSIGMELKQFKGSAPAHVLK